MSGRIVDLSDRSRRNGQAMNGPGVGSEIRQRRTVHTITPVHEWDVDAVVMLTIERGALPNVACVRLIITVDSLQRGYEASVVREGWQHSLTLQGRRRPDETLEQAARREGVIVFLNELLSASYGVPA